MADTTPETKEEREARWWRDWWAADYSWDGLAKKEIFGGGQWGEKTLQDYWRRDPTSGKVRTDAALRKSGELVEFCGRWWHLVHLPMKADLTPGDCARLSAIIGERLALAKETPGTFGYLPPTFAFVFRHSGQDRRARLDGMVDCTLPRLPPLEGNPQSVHLCCDGTRFLGDLDCQGATFGPGANFASAMFFRGAEFDRATFSGTVSFNGAIFSGDAGFNSSIFSLDVSFNKVAFFGETNLANATFAKDVAFDEATFSRRVGLESAIFSGKTNFYATVFSGEARFDDTTFADDAAFDSATFSEGVSFDSSRFAKNATFSGRHHSHGSFRNTVFERGGSFHNAVFERQVIFSAQVDQPELGFAGAFHGARFAGIADFSGAGPPRPGTTDCNDGARMAIAFAEALFEKTLILTDGSDAEAARAFRDGTMKVVRDTPKGQQRDDLLEKLETGYRTVKIAMGKARDEVREQRYYRFQLQAHQARRDTPRLERFFGWLYRRVSDYGGSLDRPLVYLVRLAVLCSLVYWLWAGGMNGTLAADLAAIAAAPCSGDSWANPAAAMSFSVGRSLFLNAWLGVPEKDPTTWQWVFLHGYGPGWGLLVRLVAALQSILSGILLFLFALAVRRRFQIGG